MPFQKENKLWKKANHKGQKSPMLGKKHSEKSKKKIAEKSKGRKPMFGKKHSKETKEKMSLARKGEKNANWKGGITLSVRLFRKSKQYQE